MPYFHGENSAKSNGKSVLDKSADSDSDKKNQEFPK